MPVHCTCHNPAVLRISLPPGSSPEIVAVIVERAIRAFLRRPREEPPWGDVPAKLSEAEYRAGLRALATGGR